MALVLREAQMNASSTRTHQTSSRLTMPALLLRLEGLALLASAVAVYIFLGDSWLAFAVLLLSPDLAALGYLYSPRLGGVLYNVVHTVSLPLLLGVSSLLLGLPLGIQLALIWLAHIGMDHALGYG